MFAVLWENTSPYFLLTVLLSIFCLLLTFLFRAANSSQSEDEVPRVEGSNVKSLVQAKPLLLAKELENNLPEHVKVLEKR